MRATFRRPFAPMGASSALSELDQLWRDLDRWAAPARTSRRTHINHRPHLSRDDSTGVWTLRVPVPGVSVDTLKLTVEDGVLSIASSPASPDDSGFTLVHRERPGPQGQIRWKLPQQADADTIEASLSEGWLEVQMAPAARAEPRIIPVRTDVHAD